MQRRLKMTVTIMVEDLMLKLLIVGDKPSRKNIDPRIAFVGTPSYKTLQKWLTVIVPEKADIVAINRVDPGFATHLISCSLEGRKIIACGEEAANALLNFGVVNFFKLPHPSGRNRKLNNKAFVAEILQKCKEWVEKD